MIPRAIQLFLILLLQCGMAANPPSGPVHEYEVKAAFLFNFARFVEWRKEPSVEESDTFVVLLAGDFPEEIEKTIHGKMSGSQRVVVKRLGDRFIPAHIVFINRHERRLPEILDAYRNQPTLLVGDGIDRFLRMGGMINFTMEDRRVRFEIHNKRAEAADLRISSRLLTLAVHVEN